MFLLITYDITDDKRRRKIEKLLSSYGVRVNYSVFEITTSKPELNTILQQLQKLSVPKEDNIRIYILNKEVLKKSFCLNGQGIFEDEQLYF